jgi:hypothetical protein
MIQLDSHLLTFDPTGHRYFLAGQPLPSVTAVLVGAKLLDYGFLDEQARARYLDRGRRVHQITHADDLARLCESTVDPEIWDYLLAWRRFRADYGFAPQLVEHMVFHPRHHYAGRLDRTGVLRGGGMAIIDIKSGTSPDATRYQLAAYSACLPHPRAWLRRAVELHADGSYRVIGYEMSTFQRDLDTFLRALEEFRTKEEKHECGCSH